MRIGITHPLERLYYNRIMTSIVFVKTFPAEAAEVKEAIWQAFSTRQQRVLNASVGIGCKVWGRITFRSIRFAMERMIMALVEDLTVERKQLLLQRQHNRELTAEINRRRKIEKDLAASEEQYRQVVESATDSIYTTDHRGRFTYLNPVALNQTGYSKEELIGQPYIRLIHPDHAEEVIKLYSMQWSERSPQTYCEFRIVAKNGATIWIGQNVQLLLKDDTAIGFQAIARDITDRKTAEERLRGISERKGGAHARDSPSGKKQFSGNFVSAHSSGRSRGGTKGRRRAHQCECSIEGNGACPRKTLRIGQSGPNTDR